MTLKLYRVTLRGLHSWTGVDLQTSYVVAENPEQAYQAVKEWCDKKDYGFREERALKSIELLAENYELTDTKTRLFLCERGSDGKAG